MIEAATQDEAEEMVWLDFLYANAAWEREQTLENWRVREATYAAFHAIYCREIGDLH
jgi:hypothetical protein